MTIPSRYFHNRSILLLLIINSVLVLIGTLLVLFRLDSNTTTNYIIEYRANLGIGEYEIGSALDIASFVFFLFWANTPKEIVTINRRIDSCFCIFRTFWKNPLFWLSEKRYNIIYGELLKSGWRGRTRNALGVERRAGVRIPHSP